MRARACLALLVVTACFDMGPHQATIEGKTPYPNPESLRAKWNAMEACSGLKGDFDKMHYYTATSIKYDGADAGGIWLKDTNEIIVSDVALEDLGHDRVVEHEDMHALLNHGGHPALFFNGVCGDLLNVWGR